MEYIIYIIGVPCLVIVGFLIVLVVGLTLAYAYAFVAGVLRLPFPAFLDRPRNATGQRVPPAIRRAVLARDGYRCQECGATQSLEMDHIIPKSRGGATTVENLQVLCHPCNMRKGVG